eukprot:6136050-Lingulodinium_polyedra.AAC.1
MVLCSVSSLALASPPLCLDGGVRPGPGARTFGFCAFLPAGCCAPLLSPFGTPPPPRGPPG